MIRGLKALISSFAFDHHNMDDDASLPKATLNSFIKELLGPNLKSTQEFSELILDISNSFIKQLSSEANRLCIKDGKKTICPEFIFSALKEMGFESFIEELDSAHNNFLEENQEKNKKKNKFNNIENWEELEAQQQKLFEMSRNFSLPAESLQKNSDELISVRPTNSENKEFDSSNLQDKKTENLKNAFEKTNDDEDYENF